MTKKQLQIHIDGAKRAGKTTVAKGIINELKKRNLKPVLIDMDEVRTKIFGKDTGKPDSAESLRYRHVIAKIICDVLTPAVLNSGGTPVVVMDHDFDQTYDQIKVLSRRFRTSLKFILVESPSFEEAKRRAELMSSDDYSDMVDWSDKKIQASFIRSVNRVEDYYRKITEPNLIKISQDNINQMIKKAVRFTLNKSKK